MERSVSQSRVIDPAGLQPRGKKLSTDVGDGGGADRCLNGSSTTDPKVGSRIASSMVSNTLDEVVEREGVGEQAPVEHVAGWPEASDARQAMGRIATATVAMR